MKKYNYLKKSLFFILLSVSIAHINANTTNNDLQDNTNENSTTTAATNENRSDIPVKKEDIEESTKLILKAITEEDFSLEVLATYVSSGDVQTNNKEQFLDNIRKLRQLLSTMARDIMMYADMQILTRCVRLVTFVQKHIKNAVNSDLKEFPKFDIEAFQLRSVTEITPDEIKNEVEELKKDLDTIKKNAEQAGIHWYNKFYRNTFDRFAIEPIAKYNLHGMIQWATCIAAAKIYLWFRFSEDPTACEGEDGELLQRYNRDSIPLFYAVNDENKTPIPLTNIDKNKIRNYMPLRVNGPNLNTNGWLQWLTEYVYPHANWYMRKKLGITHINSIDASAYDQTFYRGLTRGKLGRIDSFLTSFNTGGVALGSIYFWPEISKFYDKNITPQVSSIKKKIFNFHCWLKGGIYYKNSKNKSDLLFNINPRYRFSDIIGCKDLKELGNELVEYIVDPEKFQRQSIPPRKGILLYGAPGTGKTHFCEAFFGKIIDKLKELGRDEKEFKFLIITPPLIQYYGFDRILFEIRSCAPCIVFIDEIHLLGLQGDRNPERLAEFLSGLSGFIEEKDPKKQVIVLGATSKPENVDEAVTRTGRLDKLMHLDYPTLENRLEFLMRILDDRINPDLFNLEKIARQTPGSTIEDLRLIINTALLKTRINGRPLTQKDLEDALNSEVRKIVIHQELDLNTEEQRILAIHMAGHAVAHMHLPTQKLLAAITIKPTTERVHEESVWNQVNKDKEKRPGKTFGKMFTYCPQDSLDTSNAQILLSECKILIAGGLAEEKLLGSISSNNKRTCSGTCKPNAFNIAKQILLNGLNENQLSKSMKEEMLVKAHQLLEKLEKEVSELLEQQKPLLMFITDMLVEKKTITYDEIMFILQQAYERATKENPELIKELEKQMKEQANSQASPEKSITEQDVKNNELPNAA